MPFVEVQNESKRLDGKVHRANNLDGVDGPTEEDDNGISESMAVRTRIVEELNFVPFYFRANRGGRGHSRVGLRRWIR